MFFINFIGNSIRRAVKMFLIMYAVLTSPKSFASKVTMEDKTEPHGAQRFLVTGFGIGLAIATLAAYYLGSTHVLHPLVRGLVLFVHSIVAGSLMWLVLKALQEKELSFDEFARCFCYAVGATAIVGAIIYSTGGLYALKYPILPADLRALGIPETRWERLFCQPVESVECQGVLRSNRQVGGIYRYVLILANWSIAAYTTYVLATLLKYGFRVPRWKTFFSLVVVLVLAGMAWSVVLD